MITKAIVKEIKQQGLTRYRVGQDTGVDESVLFRLFNGGSCSIQTADVLLEYLGLEIKPKRRKGR